MLNWMIDRHTDEMGIVKYFNKFSKHQFKYLSLTMVLRKRKKKFALVVLYFVLFSCSASSKKVDLLEQILMLNSSHGTVFHDGSDWFQLSAKHILLYTFLNSECNCSCLIHIFLALGPLLLAADYLSNFFSFEKKNDKSDIH